MRRVASLDEVTPSVMSAWEQAEVYLPESVDELMESVHKTANDIRWSQLFCAAAPEREIGKPSYVAAHKDGFGSGAKKRVVELRAEARRILRPLAQLADDDRPARRARALADAAAKELPPGVAKQLPPAATK